MTLKATETLEARIAARNALTFFREFTFAQNGFQPSPNTTAELADNIIWMEDYLCLIQLKQRVQIDAGDPDAEARWFDRAVLDKGTRQIRDGLAYLAAQPEIRIANERGHVFTVKAAELATIDKIVLYEASPALPADRRGRTHHISRTAGFIHLLSLDDYLGLMEILITPGDIRLYLAYREAALRALEGSGGPPLNEMSLLGHYVGGDVEALPTPDAARHLARLVQDTDAFDMSPVLSRLQDHLVRSGDETSYYAVMVELARLPRSVLRQFKMRFIKMMAAARDRTWIRPFRFYDPERNSVFMISTMHPDVTDGGDLGVTRRVTALKNFTLAAKHEMKAGRALGVLIGKSGEWFEVEWCAMKFPWAEDPELEAWLTNNPLPFRPTREGHIDGFLLVSDE